MNQRRKALIVLLVFSFSLISRIGFSKPENEDDYHIYSGGRIVFHNGAVVEGTVEHGGMHPDTIIDFDSPEFDTLRLKVKKLIKSGLRPKELIRSITSYVQTKLFPWSASARARYEALNQQFIANGQDIPLSKYLSHHAGDCREASIVIQMALQLAGIPSFYVYTAVEVQTSSKSGAKRLEQLDHAFLVIYADENRLTLPGFGDAWVIDSLMPGLNGFALHDLQRGLNDQSKVANFFESFSKHSFHALSSFGERTIVKFHSFPKVWIPRSTGIGLPFKSAGELVRSYAKVRTDKERLEKDLKSLVELLKDATSDSRHSDDFLAKRAKLNFMLHAHYGRVFERLESKLVAYLAKISPAPLAALQTKDLYLKAATFLQIMVMAEIRTLRQSCDFYDLHSATHTLLLQWYEEQLANLGAWCSAIAHPAAQGPASILANQVKLKGSAETRVRSLLRTSPKKIKPKLDLVTNVIAALPSMITSSSSSSSSAAAAASSPACAHDHNDAKELPAAFEESLSDSWDNLMKTRESEEQKSDQDDKDDK